MKQMITKLKPLLVFAALTGFLATAFLACNNDKAATEEKIAKEAPDEMAAPTDSLPPLDPEATTKPAGGNN